MTNFDENAILIKAITDLLELNYNINIESRMFEKKRIATFIIFHKQLDIKFELHIGLNQFTINKMPLTYDEIEKELKQEYIKLLER